LFKKNEGITSDEIVKRKGFCGDFGSHIICGFVKLAHKEEFSLFI